MHRLSLISAGVIIATMVAALPGVQAWAAPMAPVEHVHAAGCHGDQPATPAPADYRCCVSGHHWAIPGVAFSGGDVAHARGGCAVGVPLVSFPFRAHSVVVIVPYFSPPGNTQLRI